MTGLLHSRYILYTRIRVDRRVRVSMLKQYCKSFLSIPFSPFSVILPNQVWCFERRCVAASFLKVGLEFFRSYDLLDCTTIFFIGNENTQKLSSAQESVFLGQTGNPFHRKNWLTFYTDFKSVACFELGHHL